MESKRMKKNPLQNTLFQAGETLGELLLEPFNRFASMQAASGILLLAATVVALVWVNSNLAESYEWLKHSHLEIRISDYSLDKSVHFWINEGLMTIFFFVVGLEIKREMLVGELASFRQAALPFTAALGGMIAPAAIYYLLNAQTPWVKGWGVPMATDIAFTMAAFTLLGSRVPHTLKVFFVSLAIVDDLGAVAVIAIFYTSQLAVGYLFLAGIWLIVLVSFNILGYRRPLSYLLVGLMVWWSLYMSGAHSTVAGILVAFTIPARCRHDMMTFSNRLAKIADGLKCAQVSCHNNCPNDDQQNMVRKLENLCRDVQTPLQRIEYSLHPWVVFLIVPLFALANAGVILEWVQMSETLTTTLSLGITIGLFVGKQLGIFIATWIAVRAGFAVMPAGVSFGQIYGSAILGGVGFTMSIFIADLAFGESPELDASKISILLASLISFIVGFLVLYVTSQSKTNGEGDEPEIVQT